jgi:hypothetical protein
MGNGKISSLMVSEYLFLRLEVTLWVSLKMDWWMALPKCFIPMEINIKVSGVEVTIMALVER